jgi:rhomboid family GlyGly-CTERM serine protease
VKRIPWVTLVIAGAALAVWWSGIPSYDRAAIGHGEVWRLVTGHLAHWSAAQLGWDVLAFTALGIYCERERGHASFVAVVLAAALTASAFLYFGCPEVTEYRGLSAIDSALWCWAAFLVAPRSQLLTILLLSLFAAKLVAEVSSGVTLFASLAGAVRVLPFVHLAGAIAGMVMALAGRRCDALHGADFFTRPEVCRVDFAPWYCPDTPTDQAPPQAGHGSCIARLVTLS